MIKTTTLKQTAIELIEFVPDSYIDILLKGNKDFLESEIEDPLIMSPKILIAYLDVND